MGDQYEKAMAAHLKALLYLRGTKEQFKRQDKPLTSYIKTHQFRIQVLCKWRGETVVVKLWNIFCEEAEE